MKKCFRKNIERKILLNTLCIRYCKFIKRVSLLRVRNIVSKKHILVTGDIVPKICYIVFVINKIAFSFSKKKICEG